MIDPTAVEGLVDPLASAVPIGWAAIGVRKWFRGRERRTDAQAINPWSSPSRPGPYDDVTMSDVAVDPELKSNVFEGKAGQAELS
jgi:hypothetical protein